LLLFIKAPGKMGSQLEAVSAQALAASSFAQLAFVKASYSLTLSQTKSSYGCLASCHVLWVLGANLSRFQKKSVAKMKLTLSKYFLSPLSLPFLEGFIRA